MIDKTQKQIIRQSSLKAAIDFHKLNGNSDISENDVMLYSLIGSYHIDPKK